MLRGRLIFQDTMEKQWKSKVKQFADTQTQSVTTVGNRPSGNQVTDDTNNDNGHCPLDLPSETDNVLGANLMEDMADETLREHMQFDNGDPDEYTSIWQAEDSSVFNNMLSLFENVLTFYRWLRRLSF